VSREELKNIIRSAWCTVLPSFSEVSPNTIADALQAGTPYICTRFVGWPAHPETYGIIVDPLKEDEIAHAFEVMGGEAAHARYVKQIEETHMERGEREMVREYLHVIAPYRRASTKKYVKALFYAILSGIDAVLPRKRGAAVLLYHDIGESELYLTVSRRAFEKQMRYLKEKRWNVVSLEKLLELTLSGDAIPHKTVALTFDDGYRSHLSLVSPVLERYGFPATFFIPTGALGGVLSNTEGRSQPILRENEVRQLAALPYAKVEPHSQSHRELTTLSADEVRKEIEESRALLEKIAERGCGIFAYPRGAWSEEAIEILKEEGFTGAVTTEPTMVYAGENPYLLPRYTINSETGMAEFRAKLSRAGNWASRLRKIYN
jgi:peptidoglycan/xylan/chitin deacetylase (PgdA/CDA1 family)